MKTCSGVFKETSPIFVTLTFGKKSQVIGKKKITLVCPKTATRRKRSTRMAIEKLFALHSNTINFCKYNNGKTYS